MQDEAVLKEIAYYYPNHMWAESDWIKSMIVFFDGVALLVPDYMREKPALADPAVVAGLEDQGLLHILDPSEVIDADATAQLAKLLGEIMESGALDHLSKQTAFHQLSMSRLGYDSDSALAGKMFDELKRQRLARETEDGKSIPVHPMVRSLVLVLLSQILRAHGPKIGAELSPITDRQDVMSALSDILATNMVPSSGAVISFDLQSVGVDLGSVPIDEILDFRKQHLAEHRRYCLSTKKFSHDLSLMPEDSRATAFKLRQAELDDLAADLRKKALVAWRKPAALALSLTGAAVSFASGHASLGTMFSVGGSIMGYSPAAKPNMGAYSYLFAASTRFSS